MTAEAERKTLLLVEDDETNREGLADYLRREGFDVVPLADGRQALDHLRQHPKPDLILLDMLLPVLDGWRFLEEVREAGIKPLPPIIIATGTQAIGREWAFAHGCAGFVHKPIDPAALQDEIMRCLEEHDHRQEQIAAS
jgi:CheY-like chemotaxis protein